MVDELTAIAFANGTDYAEFIEEGGQFSCKPVIPEDKENAVAQIKQGRYGVEISLYDKFKAIDMLRQLCKLDGFGEYKSVTIIDDMGSPEPYSLKDKLYGSYEDNDNSDNSEEDYDER